MITSKNRPFIRGPTQLAEHVGQDLYSTLFPQFVRRDYVGVPYRLIFVKTEYAFKNLTNLISRINTRQRVLT